LRFLEKFCKAKDVMKPQTVFDGRVGTLVEQEAHHLFSIAFNMGCVTKRRSPVIGHFVLSIQSVDVEPEAVYKVFNHGHPDGPPFRIPAAPSRTLDGAMQSARAEPGASGMEEGEGVDRTSSCNDFEKRRAAI
jgi:hypothetical protein